MACYWIRNTETSLTKLRRASRGVAVLPLASIGLAPAGAIMNDLQSVRGERAWT